LFKKTKVSTFLAFKQFQCLAVIMPALENNLPEETDVAGMPSKP